MGFIGWYFETAILLTYVFRVTKILGCVPGSILPDPIAGLKAKGIAPCTISTSVVGFRTLSDLSQLKSNESEFDYQTNADLLGSSYGILSPYVQYWLSNGLPYVINFFNASNNPPLFPQGQLYIKCPKNMLLNGDSDFGLFQCTCPDSAGFCRWDDVHRLISVRCIELERLPYPVDLIYDQKVIPGSLLEFNPDPVLHRNEPLIFNGTIVSVSCKDRTEVLGLVGNNSRTFHFLCVSVGNCSLFMDMQMQKSYQDGLSGFSCGKSCPAIDPKLDFNSLNSTANVTANSETIKEAPVAPFTNIALHCFPGFSCEIEKRACQFACRGNGTWTSTPTASNFKCISHCSYC